MGTSRRLRLQARGGAMQARRGAHFVANAVPFFAFMVGGSYGISVLLQGRNDVRDAKADVTDVRAPGKTQRVRRKNRSTWRLRTRCVFLVGVCAFSSFVSTRLTRDVHA